MRKQEGEFEKATDDALRRLFQMPKRVGLLVGKELVLQTQLSEIGNVSDVAVSDFGGWSTEVLALAIRVPMLRDELDLLKHRESTNCDLKVTTRNLADA